MIYLDQNGTKKETGPFALDINYKNVVSKGNTIPKYREKLNEKIQNWIDRGAKVNNKKYESIVVISILSYF